LPHDWEIVARHGNYGGVWSIVIRIVMGEPDPGPPSTITWTVRQKSTAEFRKVTASTEREAVTKIANRQFDP